MMWAKDSILDFHVKWQGISQLVLSIKSSQRDQEQLTLRSRGNWFTVFGRLCKIHRVQKLALATCMERKARKNKPFVRVRSIGSSVKRSREKVWWKKWIHISGIWRNQKAPRTGEQFWGWKRVAKTLYFGHEIPHPLATTNGENFQRGRTGPPCLSCPYLERSQLHRFMSSIRYRRTLPNCYEMQLMSHVLWNTLNCCGVESLSHNQSSWITLTGLSRMLVRPVRKTNKGWCHKIEWKQYESQKRTRGNQGGRLLVRGRVWKS